MSIGTNNVLEVRTRSSLLGQTCRNVFHYRVVSTEALVDEQHVAEQFALWYNIHINTILNPAAVLEQVMVLNLTNGVGLGDAAVNQPGDHAGAVLPPFVAAGFRLNRATQTTRHGYKRFSGINEEDVANGVYVSGAVSLFEDVATALFESVIVTGTVDLDFEIHPIIVGRSLVEGTYVIDLTRTNEIASVTVLDPTTQNTRKFRRGE